MQKRALTHAYSTWLKKRKRNRLQNKRVKTLNARVNNDRNMAHSLFNKNQNCSLVIAQALQLTTTGTKREKLERIFYCPSREEVSSFHVVALRMKRIHPYLASLADPSFSYITLLLQREILQWADLPANTSEKSKTIIKDFTEFHMFPYE